VREPLRFYTQRRSESENGEICRLIVKISGSASSSRLVTASAVEAQTERTSWDPKDGELCEARSKPEETLVEDCSGSNVQIDRRSFV
jgi:hypothetical protein